jgi:glycosyl transferase family 25
MARSSQIPVLAINLDRCRERWLALLESARTHDIEVTRVPAVDGSRVPPNEWAEVDKKAFRRQHGREILPGEYGCYRSHLAALRLAANSGSPFSIVIEDDILPDRSALSRVDAIIDAVERLDVVKLVNHRARLFRPAFRTALGDKVGRTLWGPQGSAAAYLVSADGAAKLHRELSWMSLPWDVALERYWATRTVFYSVKYNVFQLSKIGPSTISSGGYGSTKLAQWRRGPMVVFRSIDFGRRVAGALLPAEHG